MELHLNKTPNTRRLNVGSGLSLAADLSHLVARGVGAMCQESSMVNDNCAANEMFAVELMTTENAN